MTVATANRPPVSFDPIQQLRAHEYVAEQIRRHIALRLVGPGEALPSERELAAMFGVGRPTIQHAMRLLETTADPTSQIQRRSGYADPAAFRRAFTQATGLSPRRYRDAYGLTSNHRRG